MSQHQDTTDQPTPIASKQELVDYLASGCKPESDWRIGTEHEKFGFCWDTLKPLPFAGEHGIEAILKGLQHQFDWQPIHEDGHLIALLKDGCSVTLEPGGQLELSGKPLMNLHQTCDEVHTHLHQVKTVADPLNVGFVGLGFQPKWRREDMQWMPKQRYKIMREHMLKVGTLGHDMMTRTCTIQVNLDFSSEADMVKKFRVGLALQPLATALFADSALVDGKPSGYLSYRAHIWTDTDHQRTGQLPFVFESGMGFERYVDYMLDVPMYFVYRDGQHINAAGQSFRDFLQGKLPALPGELPSIKDWDDHLTTAFPEVRLKRFLEMRGADGGPWRRICALPALWVGLLYHQPSLDAAWELVKDWTAQDRAQLMEDVSREGLRASVRGQPLIELAKSVLKLSHDGLIARDQLNQKGQNETSFLSALDDVVACGVSPAEKKLRLYNEKWGQNVDPIFREFAY